MDENNNVILEENVSVESETEQAESKILHVDKSKHIFDIVYLAFCSAFTLIMWCTGYNFLPLISDILGIVAGVLVFARLLSKKNVGLYLWISYIVCMCGLFVYFLIWGAESFGKNLWYNFVLVLFPVLLATFVYLADKVLKKQLALRITCAVCAFLMAGTAIINVFFYNLRLRPTCESLQEGHDEYLKNVAAKYQTNSNSPNVLVILMDDMGYSDISAYSYLGSKKPPSTRPTSTLSPTTAS